MLQRSLACGYPPCFAGRDRAISATSSRHAANGCSGVHTSWFHRCRASPVAQSVTMPQVHITKTHRASAVVVKAAAVWPGPDASFDEEQSWWAAGPLSWRTADEREQWKAEQQLHKQHKAQHSFKAQAPAAGEALSSLDKEGIDAEQQWLQPPVLLEPPQ